MYLKSETFSRKKILRLLRRYTTKVRKLNIIFYTRILCYHLSVHQQKEGSGFNIKDEMVKYSTISVFVRSFIRRNSVVYVDGY